jgi:hypothetical protein
MNLYFFSSPCYRAAQLAGVLKAFQIEEFIQWAVSKVYHPTSLCS